jgi:hypothetical protein
MLNPIPCPARNGIPNRRLVYSVLTCPGGKASPDYVRLPKFSHDFLAQYRLRFPSASRRASFYDRVMHILGMSSDPKVRGIDAPRIVATRTVVQNVFSFRYRSSVNYPAKPVRQALCFAVEDNAVTSADRGAFPKPTRAGNFNLRPKAPENCGRGKSLSEKVLSLIVGPLDQFHVAGWVTPRAVQAAPGHFCSLLSQVSVSTGKPA